MRRVYLQRLHLIPHRPPTRAQYTGGRAGERQQRANRETLNSDHLCTALYT